MGKHGACLQCLIGSLSRTQECLARRHAHLREHHLVPAALVDLVVQARQQELTGGFARVVLNAGADLLGLRSHVHGLPNLVGVQANVGDGPHGARSPCAVVVLGEGVHHLDHRVQRLGDLALRRLQLSDHLQGHGLTGMITRLKEQLVGCFGLEQGLVSVTAQAEGAGGHQERARLSSPVALLVEGLRGLLRGLDGFLEICGVHAKLSERTEGHALLCAALGDRHGIPQRVLCLLKHPLIHVDRSDGVQHLELLHPVLERPDVAQSLLVGRNGLLAVALRQLSPGQDPQGDNLLALVARLFGGFDPVLGHLHSLPRLTVLGQCHHVGKSLLVSLLERQGLLCQGQGLLRPAQRAVPLRQLAERSGLHLLQPQITHQGQCCLHCLDRLLVHAAEGLGEREAVQREGLRAAVFCLLCNCQRLVGHFPCSVEVVLLAVDGTQLVECCSLQGLFTEPAEDSQGLVGPPLRLGPLPGAPPLAVELREAQEHDALLPRLPGRPEPLQALLGHRLALLRLGP
mmetsp:Transcript_112879/g.319299  ORF Transcript_112879/g.319299 Transcript_112879/m.319299 type:complete len:515 (+) Transcript_112879:706-2250(+)